MITIKFLIEIILVTIIIFFVWNILKRMFFNAFYKNFPGFNPQNRPNSSQKTSKRKVDWDAETVEYEEVKEENSK